MLFEQFDSTLGGRVENLMDFFVDDFHRVFAELATLVHLATQERIVVGHLVADWAQSLAHAPMRDHAACHRSGSLQIVFGANGQFIVDDLLGSSTGQQYN